MEKGLEVLGLSKKEAQVYFALVRASQSSVGKLSQLTGINRRSVYDCAESLMASGLVSYQILARKRFSSPQSSRALMQCSRKKGRLQSPCR